MHVELVKMKVVPTGDTHDVNDGRKFTSFSTWLIDPQKWTS